MEFVSNSLLRVVVIIFCVLSLVGCGDEKGHPKEAKAKDTSPEQTACILKAENEHLAQAESFAKKQIDAMMNLHSTIELTIAERRMDEQTCLEEAKCYGKDELIVSTMFDSCLDSVEIDGNRN